MAMKFGTQWIKSKLKDCHSILGSDWCNNGSGRAGELGKRVPFNRSTAPPRGFLLVPDRDRDGSPVLGRCTRPPAHGEVAPL